MPSLPLGSTDSRTTSGIACHHRPWTANMVERRQAWHAIIAFGQHRRSDGIRRGMPSSPLASTHSQTTSGVSCHHRLGKAHTVGRRWELHAIIAFGQHTQSNDVWRGMPSSPLGATQDRTMSSVACHLHLWAAHTIERRGAWYDITAIGKHTRSATSNVA